MNDEEKLQIKQKYQLSYTYNLEVTTRIREVETEVEKCCENKDLIFIFSIRMHAIISS
jgi:hypothetical protein